MEEEEEDEVKVKPCEVSGVEVFRVKFNHFWGLKVVNFEVK